MRFSGRILWPVRWANRLLEGRRFDGSTFLVEVALSPVVDGAATSVLAIVRDITDRVGAEELARRTMAATAVVDDRARIARDLHDKVIPELFASGLMLANAASSTDRATSETLHTVVEIIDDSIRRVRETVFRLQGPAGSDQDLTRIAHEAARALGFEPQLTINGHLDALSSDLYVEVAAVVKEGLSNVARHARASGVWVVVDICDDQVLVRIADDGVGISRGMSPGTGLASLATRASLIGGTFAVAPGPGGLGTHLTWWAPMVSQTN